MWSYRLRRLIRGLALPGWAAILWGIIEKASTVAWLREAWIALSPKIAVVIDSGTIVGVLGFGWLVWLILRKPRTINLNEFAKARGRRGLILEDEIFRNRTIEGPTTVYLDAGTEIEDSFFDGVSYAVLSDDQKVICGAISLRNCKIERCTFRRVGFIGHAATIAKMRAAIQTVALPPGHKVVRDDD